MLTKICLVLVALFAVSLSSRLLGGWNVASPQHKSVQKIALNVTSKLSENGNESEVAEICEALTQVVAGVNYKINMIVKNKGSSDDSTNRYCTFQAYEVIWNNSLEIQNLTCDEKQTSCPEKKS